jgi:hypothetical protein
LGVRLFFLVSKSTLIVPRKHNQRTRYATTREHHERMTRRYLKVELRPLDSSDALKGFEKRDLIRLQDQLIKLSEKLDKLSSTELIRQMAVDGEFNRETQLFSLPYDLMIYSQVVISHILEKFDSVGSKQRPDYTQYLAEIFTHIYERTGKWHDSEVADIINELNSEKDVDVETQQSLKQWRHRHGVKTAR